MTPEEWQKVRPILESALELDPASRSAFVDSACAGDESLRRELESLIAAHEQGGTELLNPAPVPSLSTLEEARFRLLLGKRVGPYQILEEIALGGMGAVYRAIRADGQYKQQVALKIVRADLGGEQTATRFRNERQILASLDHPNIAKILDGGTTADGLPYFVMELIDGQRITEYCDQHRLTINERLKLFRIVCSAVHYAHQHLVIHRDLKPSNILVTSDGVPKLLDFGIAKILDPSLLPQNVTVTAAGLWMMTPEYASPEQLRGEAITTATDVYSLGLVLYELLTGHHAYRFASQMPHEIARAVLETEPEKPSTAIRRKEEGAAGGQQETLPTPEIVSGQRDLSPEKLRRRLAGDLDNIVLKALRKEPRERYNSADQFSEDIRCHLQQLPVLARRSTIAYRCRKYVLRHKVGLAAAALVFLSLLTGIALTLREARIARANQIRAEQHFNDVRKLANSLMFEIHDSIRDLPGSTAARRILVDRALGYLDSLAQESQGDPGLQRELAAAYERVGKVQGDPNFPNLGDSAGALKSLQKALAIRRGIAEAHAANLDDQIALAASYRQLCKLQGAYVGDVEAALGNCRRAVGITAGLNQLHSENKSLWNELASDYGALGDIQAGGGTRGGIGDVYAALESMKRAFSLQEKLAKALPNDATLQSSLAALGTKIGDNLVQTGDRSQAFLRYREASAIFEGLAKDANNAVFQRSLALINSRIGDLLLIDGRFAQSISYYQKELQLIRPMAAADPNNIDSRFLAGAAYANVGYALFRAGYRRQGLAALNRGLEELSKINESHPNAEFRAGLGLVKIWMGSALEQSGDLHGAFGTYTHGQTIFAGLVSVDTKNLQHRLMLAGAENQIAEIYARQGKWENARAEYQKALAVTEPLASGTPANPESLYSTVNSYSGLGDVSVAFARKASSRDRRMRFWTEAQAWYQKALQSLHRISNPGVVSPNGFDLRDSQSIAVQLAHCESALRDSSTQPR